MDRKILIIGLVFFVVSGVISYFISSKSNVGNIFKSPLSNYKPPSSDNGTVVNNSEPKTEECPMNGEMLTQTQRKLWETRRPLGIMIENHKEARPQSGLSSADIIYEVVAEGGISRFLAIFYCKDAKYVGPVRSARIYFINLLSEYGENPLYAHVGGANTSGPADALGKIKELEWDVYNDLNQFAVPFPYYWRDYDRLPDRATEHTMYSSTSKLWEFAKTKRLLTNIDENNISWDKNFTKWKFKEDESSKGTVAKINFDFWDSMKDYTVEWQYNKTNNTYIRFNGGEPHLDKNTGKQLETKNLLVLHVVESPANDGYEGGHLLYKVIGSGDGVLFQDGKAKEISWTKKNITSRMLFTDENGKEINFNRGQIFIEIIPDENKITY